MGFTFRVPATPAVTLKGYVAGGMLTSTSTTASIQSLTFDTESVSALSATLATARGYLSGANSSTRGYFTSGLSGGGSGLSEVDGIIFATEAAINPSSVAGALWTTTAVNSTTNGYFAGGTNNGSTAVSSIVRLQFNDETTSTIAATMSVARYGAGGVSSSTRGYFLSGFGPNFNTEIDGIRFDTEAAINPTATVAISRLAPAAFNSLTRGYIAGGYWGPGDTLKDIDGIRFDTEAAINPTSSLTTAQGRINAGVNSLTKGYTAGGSTDANTPQNVINNFVFDTETTATVTATLTVARYAATGVQSGSL